MTTTTTSSDNRVLESAEALFSRAREAMFEMFKFPKSGGNTVDTVADRIIDSQKQGAELIEAFAKSWMDLAQQNAFQPDSWKDVIDKWTESLGKLESPFDAAGVMKSWKEGGDKLMESWRSMWTGMPSSLGSMPEQGELTAFLSSPGFGMGREYQAKLNHLFEAWLVQQAKEAEYKKLLARTWSEAFRAVSEEIGRRLTEARPIEDAKEMIDIWVKVADEKFLEVFVTEEFSLLQTSMLNAAHKVRRLRRELVDSHLRSNDMPTKGDVDEAHRVIYNLRKEVRALAKQVERLQNRGDEENR